MPVVGNVLAGGRKEPVSWFNQTDEEVDMHNRVWRFLVAEHTNDWFYNTAVELQRTRIIPAVDHNFRVDLYYNWLKQTPYNSSPVRYHTVGADVLADTDTVPGTFTAICKVIEIDRQRVTSGDILTNIEPEMRQSVEARRAENTAYIAWFVRALNYRNDSYGYALDHLLVETPHPQSVGVDQKLRTMQRLVDRANRGEFCPGGPAAASNGGHAVASRYEALAIDNEVIGIK